MEDNSSTLSQNNEAFIIHTLGVLGGKLETLVTLREDIKRTIEEAVGPLKTTLKEHDHRIENLEQSKQRAYGAMAIVSIVLTACGGIAYFVMQKLFGVH